ncbi:MAG: acyl-CoA dehydrogenase family protein [Planctomycetota bacterium]|jgi:alkylation response protein AidB-like acyl-CoA dehydrogenase
MSLENNFSLSEEQDMIRDTVRKFVQDVAQPAALAADEERAFVGDNLSGLAELGLLGLPVSEDSGGLGLGMLSFSIALEEIAKACGSTAALMLTQAGLCGRALEGIEAAGELLGEIIGGEKTVGFIGPESKIIAGESGEELTLTGKVELCIGGEKADAVILFAKSEAGESLFLRLDAGQFTASPVPSLGFRAAAPAALSFDAAVPSSSIIARGDAADQAMDRAQQAAQIGGAALALGAAQSCIELSMTYAKERMAFGKPLAKQQAVTHKLVELYRHRDAARHQTYHAARLADAGQDCRSEGMMARIAAQDAAVLAGDEGIQIHGGFGFTTEYHVERHYRDAKTLEVLHQGPDWMRDRLGVEIGTLG